MVRMTVADRAMTQLESWPNLISGSPRCAAGRAFGTTGHDIVHFHSDDAADLHLTHAAVHRLLPHLQHSTAVRVHPGSSWITVLLDCDSDVALLLTLVSVALKEHDGAGGDPPEGPSTLCDWQPPAIPSPRAGAFAAVRHRRVPAAWKAVGRFIPHGR